MAGPGASKRYTITLIAVSTTLVFFFISFFRSQPVGTRRPDHDFLQSQGFTAANMMTGHSIMPQLGNETAKAELGRATWKYFHTVMARFPEKPTEDESTALQTYIHLFTRLYPCGECSEHFRTILDKFPPQTSSRSTAAVWACHVHNEVNKSLNKEIFDCSEIGDFYDCGCAEDKETESRGESKPDTEMSVERKEMITGSNGRDVNMDLLKEDYWRDMEKKES